MGLTWHVDIPIISDDSILTLKYCFCNSFTTRPCFTVCNIILSYHVYIDTTFRLRFPPRNFNCHDSENPLFLGQARTRL